jgi:hypothetical protein
VAIGASQQNFTPSRPITEPAPSLRLQQLIDTGAVYVAQNLSPSQFATLQAIASRVLVRHTPKDIAAHLDAALDYQLGLDELDTITRTRTGYAFAELPAEIQDAILGLITSRDLTSRKLDLVFWLEELHSNAATAL